MAIFIITFRETLEAAIITGLIFSMLKIFGVEKNRKRYIGMGIIAGILVSFFFAGIFEYFFGGFTGKAEKIYEGTLMLFACLMISQFLIWTNANFKNIGKRIKTSVEGIISAKQLWMLSILVFASVLREGVETVIFLNALDFSFTNTDILFALLGILGAILIAYILFFSIQKINISRVLFYTNILFIFIAAGLLSHSIVEFQGAGIVAIIIKPFFDLSYILSEKEGVGAILKATFNYDANPSLLAFSAYILYIFSFAYYLFFRKK